LIARRRPSVFESLAGLLCLVLSLATSAQTSGGSAPGEILETPGDILPKVVRPVEAAEAPEETPPQEGFPLLVAGREIFRIRSPLGAFSAEERAKAASERIREVVKASGFDAGQIQMREGDGQYRVLSGERVLFTILVADLPDEDRETPALAADRVARALGSAIDLDRKARGPKRLALSAGLTLLVLALLIVLGRLVLRGARRLARRVEGWKGTVIRGLRLRGLELLSAEAMVKGALTLVRLLRVGALFLLGYVGFSSILALFPWTQPYGRASAQFVLGVLARTLQGIIGYVPNLVTIVLTLIVVFYINRFVRFLFDAVGRGVLVIPGLHSELAQPTRQILSALIWLLGLVVILPYLPGAGSPAFQGVSLFVGLMLSLGSSGAIGNLVAGLVLTYSRSFSVGDRVKIGDTVGDVVSHGMLSTKVVTIKNEEITIPNAAILGSHIVNYTELAQGPGLIVHTTVTIGYDVPWRTVTELLLGAARSTSMILEAPKPFVLQTSLDDFYVSYQINAYTREASKQAVIYHELHQNIQDKFNAAGVEIMSPHYRALRDGNEVTVPAGERPAGYEPPAFRVRSVGGADGTGSATGPGH